MSKSENVALYKYLTRPASPQLPGARSERQMYAKGSTVSSQLPLEDYITIVKEMVADPNYRPPININPKEVGKIPFFEKAKEIVKAEMGDGFTQAYQRNLNRGRKVRAKEKRKVDPELKAKYLASKAERRRARRIEKLGGDVKKTPAEKFLNFQQSLVTKQLNEKIRQNPDLILKNEALMDQLSTTVDKDGNFICGYDLNNVYTGFSPTPIDTPAKGGLFVISGRRQNGYLFSGVGNNVKEAGPVDSSFRSAWINFGDMTIKKQVKYVYLTILTAGDVELGMTAYKDRDWSTGTNLGDLKLQRPDHKDQSVYDSKDYHWDTTGYWQDKLLTRLRFDCANMSCSEFAFEFSTTDKCEFIGYQIEYTVDGTKIIGGKRGL